ncbi:MAG TPA: hypothetical protein VKV15_23560 [Bryobacteraceae bacterium]|nr:hypothetical protein [Bryobacteraceae bacterium]
MKIACSLGLLVGLTGCALLAQNYPEAEISNGLVHAKLYLPDAERGSYRGTRFDWSGIVSSLQYDGHEYFGQWYEHHDPKIHDAITGPVEEFKTNDAGLGYAEAQPGGTFIRIGVGVVRKPEEKAYRAFGTYEIVDPGQRTVRKGRNWIEFGHRLASDDGYAYVYRKTLRLTKGKPQLVIEHSLKNTGRKVIETALYDHNFFVIDREVVGPGIAVRFPFVPKPVAELKNGGEIRGQEITYSRELQKGESVFSEMQGFDDSANDYDIRIENRNSGAGVRITGDHPLAKVVFWSIRTVACPEPYIKLRIEPGHESKWRIVYDFYTLPSVAAK